MTFMKWAATAAAVAGMALVSGCGGGGSGSNGDIRLINASVGYPTLDMSVNGNVVGTGVAYGAASAYSNQNTNGTLATLSVSGTTVRTPGLSSVLCGARCSLIAYGWSGSILNTVLPENQPTPPAGYAQLNVQNLAPDAGSLDVYLTASPSTPLSSPTATAGAGYSSGFQNIGVGTSGATYTVTITGTGNPTDVRLQIPSITIPNLQVATLIVTPTSGGVLVNAILAIQNGALSTYSGSSSRVRVVSGVTGTNATTPSSVSATMPVNGVTTTLLDPAFSSPSVGDYITVPAGAAPMTVTVNGTPYVVPAAQQTLALGGDYTLLLWGTPSNVQSKLIADDNRLPTTAGTAKFRLTNGLTNQSGGLNLALAFSPLVTNVLPGNTGVPTLPVAVTANTVDLQVQAGGTAIFENTALTVAQGAVYEVMMLGDASLPVTNPQFVRLLRTAR